MDGNESLILWILVGIIIWFILWFISWFIIKNKVDVKIEKVLGFIFFIVWVWMHLYGFLHSMEIPMVFDVVGAGSAGMMLWIKTSEKFTEVLLSKITGWK